MTDEIYSKFGGEALTLRDELAVDRTLLANERTLLAYLRSGVALLLAGVSIVHFSQQGWFWAVGIACLPAGICTGILGMARHRKMNRSISLIRGQAGKRTASTAEEARQGGGQSPLSPSPDQSTAP